MFPVFDYNEARSLLRKQHLLMVLIKFSDFHRTLLKFIAKTTFPWKRIAVCWNVYQVFATLTAGKHENRFYRVSALTSHTEKMIN